MGHFFPSRFGLFSNQVSDRFFDRFWIAQGRPRSHPGASQGTPRPPPNPPRPPKIAPRSPKTSPRPPKTAPRATQESPRPPQERLKTEQKTTPKKKLTKHPKCLQNARTHTHTRALRKIRRPRASGDGEPPPSPRPPPLFFYSSGSATQRPSLKSASRHPPLPHFLERKYLQERPKSNQDHSKSSQERFYLISSRENASKRPHKKPFPARTGSALHFGTSL